MDQSSLRACKPTQILELAIPRDARFPLLRNRAIPWSATVPIAIIIATPNSPYKAPAALPTANNTNVAWAAIASSSCR